jgi:uncharacterized membrane protein
MALAFPLRKGRLLFGARRWQVGTMLVHPRFLLFFGLFPLAVALLWRQLGPVPALMAGFDIAACLFLVSIVLMMNSDTVETMRRRAAGNDASKALLLLLAGLVVATIMATVALGLPLAIAAPTLAGIMLPLATLVLAWLFGSAVMALHYAHIYYDSALRRDPAAPPDADHGGLAFPQTDCPDYWDFAYFSLNLGMTYQVSDVAVTSPRLRRIIILHCVVAFFFNIGVLALAISIVGGLVFQPK